MNSQSSGDTNVIYNDIKTADIDNIGMKKSKYNLTFYELFEKITDLENQLVSLGIMYNNGTIDFDYFHNYIMEFLNNLYVIKTAINVKLFKEQHG